MTGRIRVHPEATFTPVVIEIERRGAEREHLLLRGRHVVHREVEVCLLRVGVGARPVRGAVAGTRWKAIRAPPGSRSTHQSS